MDQFRIQGGAPLRGEIAASGSKNATLPILAASLLAEEPCLLRGVPRLRDIETFLELLDGFGVRHQWTGRDELRLDPARARSGTAPYDLVRTMRASVMVLGPLVARFGHARVSLPGGCAIGARPIDQHLKGLEALGAEIGLEAGYIEARARRLRGARISFDLSTVTGTKNLMMAASLAEGVTVLENAAREPEVGALADLLNRMGARVRGAGTSVIEVEGVESLRGFEVDVLPDRIETGTLMIAGAITGGDVKVRRCVPAHVDALSIRLREAGLSVTEGEDWVRVESQGVIRPVNVKTAPYPGFPTDLQAQFMALMAVADGACAITETIFENRFMHAAELVRMGARISLDGRTAHVEGAPGLQGAVVMATDLRASASLVLAGLAASGETIVRRVYHLDRGYERLEARLRSLGADIERVAE
ncbi:MAG: UDP-N-acetylglucosamine 1-carboxyvinyltransferase [Candidatus Tectomicrobia bacterium]|uniref:UDP-N-acetylglucosamine 1-carboxyvinyltransferase n=1 Tax=Tectimicrobiota bacterium TaxID=2528274 RepID=A0A932MN74_UNCTE|nr:UDP-N-acetylglucosamine 1-carboxyvinyltransferase [Candidatus Tectomicrobia bacterium]